VTAAAERISITDREQWLALRKPDVTASVVGALRGLHPYTSRLRLYKEKTGFEFETTENVRMRRGRRLEKIIGEVVEEKRPGWKVVPAGVYLRDPSLRLGCTPDFFIEGDPRGLGILQTKLTMPRVFKREWLDEQGAVAPPMWIQLQALTEAMLADAAFGAIAAYMDGEWQEPDEVEIFEFDRHSGAEAAIRSDVEKFWEDVDFQIEPEAKGAVDAEIVALMHPEPTVMSRVDLTGDNYLTDALFERERLKDQVNTANERIKEIDTELKAKMGDAGIAVVGPFYALQKNIDVDGYTVAPRRYRRLTVTNMMPKEASTDGQPTRF
jgi:predicted phage-related endonuclease